MHSRRIVPARQGASSAESLLLVLGVGVALLVAVTVLGRKLANLDKNASGSLDRGSPIGKSTAVADLPGGALPGDGSIGGTGGAGSGGSGGTGSGNSGDSGSVSTPVLNDPGNESALVTKKKRLKKKDGEPDFTSTGPMDTLGTKKIEVDPDSGYVSDPDAPGQLPEGFFKPGDPPRPVPRFAPSHVVKKIGRADPENIIHADEKKDGSPVYVDREAYERILRNHGFGFQRIGFSPERIPGLLTLTQTRGEFIGMYDAKFGHKVYKVKIGNRDVHVAVQVNPDGRIMDAMIPTSVTGTDPMTGESYTHVDPDQGVIDYLLVKSGNGLIYVENKTGEVVKGGVTYYVGEKAYPFVAGVAKGIGKGVYKIGEGTIAFADEAAHALADDVAYAALALYASQNGEWEYYEAYQPASTSGQLSKQGKLGETINNTANVVFEGLVNLPADAQALVADLGSGDPKRIERASARLGELGVTAVFVGVPTVNGIKHMRIKLKGKKLPKVPQDGPNVKKPTDGPDTKPKTEPIAETKPPTPVDDPIQFKETSAPDAPANNIIRETRLGDKQVKINSGHAYNRPHKGPDKIMRQFDPSKASMDDIERAIVKDIQQKLARGEQLPKLGKQSPPAEFDLEVKGVKLKYRVGETADGINVGDYYPVK